jgi:hypothetical protein
MLKGKTFSWLKHSTDSRYGCEVLFSQNGNPAGVVWKLIVVGLSGMIKPQGGLKNRPVDRIISKLSDCKQLSVQPLHHP